VHGAGARQHPACPLPRRAWVACLLFPVELRGDVAPEPVRVIDGALIHLPVLHNGNAGARHQLGETARAELHPPGSREPPGNTHTGSSPAVAASWQPCCGCCQGPVLASACPAPAGCTRSPALLLWRRRGPTRQASVLSLTAATGSPAALLPRWRPRCAAAPTWSMPSIKAGAGAPAARCRAGAPAACCPPLAPPPARCPR